MSAQWVPGDVAVAQYDRNDGPKVYVYGHKFGETQLQWIAQDGMVSVDFSFADWWRLLAVIDSEDRERVERLTRAVLNTVDLLALDNLGADWAQKLLADAIGRALREFANPQVKPAEPMGLGAVVEDANGETWVRIHLGTLAPWRGTRRPDDTRPVRYFKGIDAVKVLSEGVVTP